MTAHVVLFLCSLMGCAMPCWALTSKSFTTSCLWKDKPYVKSWGHGRMVWKDGYVRSAALHDSSSSRKSLLSMAWSRKYAAEIAVKTTQISFLQNVSKAKTGNDKEIYPWMLWGHCQKVVYVAVWTVSFKMLWWVDPDHLSTHQLLAHWLPPPVPATG